MRLARLALCNRPIMPDELAKTYYNVALTIWDGDKYGRIAVKRCLMFLCKSYECGVTNQPLCSPLCPILILDLPTCRCCTQQNRKLTFNQETPFRFSSAEDDRDRWDRSGRWQNLWASQSVVSILPILSIVDYIQIES